MIRLTRELNDEVDLSDCRWALDRALAASDPDPALAAWAREWGEAAVAAAERACDLDLPDDDLTEDDLTEGDDDR